MVKEKMNRKHSPTTATEEEITQEMKDNPRLKGERASEYAARLASIKMEKDKQQEQGEERTAEEAMGWVKPHGVYTEDMADELIAEVKKLGKNGDAAVLLDILTSMESKRDTVVFLHNGASRQMGRITSRIEEIPLVAFVAATDQAHRFRKDFVRVRMDAKYKPRVTAEELDKVYDVLVADEEMLNLLREMRMRIEKGRALSPPVGVSEDGRVDLNLLFNVPKGEKLTDVSSEE